jgi:hypothetical protein
MAQWWSDDLKRLREGGRVALLNAYAYPRDPPENSFEHP